MSEGISPERLCARCAAVAGITHDHEGRLVCRECAPIIARERRRARPRRYSNSARRAGR